MTIYELESIRIDGKDYAIDWREPNPLVEINACVDTKLLNIHINKSTVPNDLESLCHEIVHVININRLGDKLTEAEVNTIGCSLAQILLDNPEFGIATGSIGLEFDDEDEDENNSETDD